MHLLLQYLTDPVTGYIFRSMKDALRYIETGDIGRLAIKPKDKGSNDLELEDAKPDVSELISAFFQLNFVLE